MSSLHHDPARRQFASVPLLRRDSIGDAYHVLTFDWAAGPRARPGQFAMVRGSNWGHAPLLPRPMSYLSGGSTPSILVRVYGDGTRRMARSEPGDHFDLVGPLGNGWRAPIPGLRQVLVAGGVGVAPLLFLARSLIEQGRSPVLLYGGRSQRDLPLSDDLVDTCEVELATEDGSRGTHGRVTDLLGRWLGPGIEVFTCGPDPMMARVAGLCEAAGVPCEASLESPMACGYGVCLGCAVPRRDATYLYACVDGPCVDALTLDWGAAGAEPTRGPIGANGSVAADGEQPR
ncbi:MAG: dihydroorotate dehydrogenase electron transfer subunit [Polyangiaceae bacterium]|nr:dihydroorotate dehydrogenase electron transfer subunit [Polyangiaceae bacterium]